ncbi:MAG TPA: hypothetical protein DCQ56_05790 [Porphyromonadaceae bacterium]|nr:hypothetical protein [Porphyromonadaceae bacterium]
MKHIHSISVFCLLTVLAVASCSPRPHDARQSSQLPPIFPDYVDVTVPVDVAPLHFSLPDSVADYIFAEARGKGAVVMEAAGRWADFDDEQWHRLLAANKGGNITMSVTARRSDGQWVRYRDFVIHVAADSLGAWGLTYRRIAPGYESFGTMGLYQREFSSCNEYAIIENTAVPSSCVNCHAARGGDPSAFTFHVRGAHGATLVQIDGNREWLSTKTDSTLASCVYPSWHPSGRYIAYSTNLTHQAFHEVAPSVLEVFDTGSNVQIYDTQTHALIVPPQLATDEWMETYPAFSADGHTLYFCTARRQPVPDGLTEVRYNLCSVAFDASTGTVGAQVDTLFDAESRGLSAVHPRPSPDGRWLLFTTADYGCFPIWHDESEQWLLDLHSGEAHPLAEANSPLADSYHNWSPGGNWMVFTSRRADGRYSWLYLCRVDADGHATKPFLLPQRDPATYYGTALWSFNTPDFTTGRVEFDVGAGARELVSDERIQVSMSRRH